MEKHTAVNQNGSNREISPISYEKPCTMDKLLHSKVDLNIQL